MIALASRYRWGFSVMCVALTVGLALTINAQGRKPVLCDVRRAGIVRFDEGLWVHAATKMDGPGTFRVLIVGPNGRPPQTRSKAPATTLRT